jgi:LuxR family maltose regulon positive regulatory protein
MILALERANLFIVALDDRREWYRYHHLFADVLRARLLSERPAHVPLLHRRASQWYENHDLTDEAVTHAVAARDFDRAVRLIELAVPEIRRHRQEATMHRWLKALPAASVRRSPLLSLFYGAMLMATGDTSGVEPWLEDAERAHARQGTALPGADAPDLQTLPSTVAMYRAALALARGDVEGTAQHARRALDLTGPDDHLARGGAAGFLGFAAWAQGDLPGALETFTQAVASLHAAGSLVDGLSGTVMLGDLWHALGRPSEARRLCTQALASAEARGAPVARAAAELHVALSELDIDVADLESARQHLEAAAALTDQASATESRHRWFIAQARLAWAENDPERAVQLLDQAEQLHRPGFFPDVRPIASIRARIRIAQGKLAEATDWARERGVTAGDEARYLSEFDHLTLVRLLLARHRALHETGALDEATDLLDRLHGPAETAERAASLLEIRMLRALVEDAQGRRPQALATLTQALVLAPEPDGYLRLFLDEGAPLLSLLSDIKPAGVAGHQARLLLRVSGSTETGPAQNSGQRVARTAGESLSQREIQVLRLLDSELTGPQIARELFLSHNTVRTHTKHIFTKLDVVNRRAAVLRAQERGLI